MLSATSSAYLSYFHRTKIPLPSSFGKLKDNVCTICTIVKSSEPFQIWNKSKASTQNKQYDSSLFRLFLLVRVFVGCRSSPPPCLHPTVPPSNNKNLKQIWIWSDFFTVFGFWLAARECFLIYLFEIFLFCYTYIPTYLSMH